jgi:hypothetical protein
MRQGIFRTFQAIFWSKHDFQSNYFRWHFVTKVQGMFIFLNSTQKDGFFFKDIGHIKTEFHNIILNRLKSVDRKTSDGLEMIKFIFIL